MHATGYLADPHTAIGIAAGARPAAAHGVPTVAMATAHPAKFPDAMEAATGIRPPCRRAWPTYMKGRRHFTRAPNDLAAVEAAVRATALRNAA